MDLSAFAGIGDSPDSNTVKQSAEAQRLHILQLQQSFNCLDEARMPVLIALQGGVIGGGVDLSTAADCRYSTKDAFFCIQEINIGMMADLGTFPRLCHLLPQGLVRELSYTGRRMQALEAQEHGLVNEVWDTQEEMLEGVMAIARDIASKAPNAVTGSKVMINYARDHSIKDGLDYVALWQAGLAQHADIAEAIKAKTEQRAPDFPDLSPIGKGLDH